MKQSSGKHVREKFIPLNPTLIIERLGFAGVYLVFLFLLQNIDCGYSLEPPRQGSSNLYPQSMFSFFYSYKISVYCCMGKFS